MTATHRPLDFALMPTLQASNAAVVQHPDDKPQGTLVVGGQGSGKTSFMLRAFLNDCRDPNCAPILIDPKSELARRALALIPLDVDKRVWFLNLAQPRFGMSPLWLPPETMRDPRKLSARVTGVAENVVNSLLDVHEGQLFQSSRDLLYHATIGALALAAARDTRPTFEDVYNLLSPWREDVRDAVVTATSHIPRLELTREFWAREIPDALTGAAAITRQRMQAPRNKVGSIVSVPPLRAFFDHPCEVSFRSMIEARDILIVDAAMGGTDDLPGIGQENSVLCMQFLLRMLHAHMQDQIHVARPLLPRVAMYLEEAHYVVNEATIDMLATHRAAGLEPTLSYQFFAQLLAETPARSEKIRKGVMNLCQSRNIFRVSDPEDAEEASRTAMSIYDSLIRSDAEARSRNRVTPDTIMNLPRWHCLASWIADGRRAPAFIGQTYEMPPSESLGATRVHYQRMVDRCAAIAPPQSNDVSGATVTTDATDRLLAADRSAVLTIAGREISAAEYEAIGDAPPFSTLAELPIIDDILEVKDPVAARQSRTVQRYSEQQFRVIALLDRVGRMTTDQLRRAVWPDTTARAAQQFLKRMHEAGLIQFSYARLRNSGRGGSPPRLWSLTPDGFKLGQNPPSEWAAVIPGSRRFRESEAVRGARVPHDLHVVNLLQALDDLVPRWTTDRWRTPRYVTGRFAPPLVGMGREQRRLRAADVQLEKGYGFSHIPQGGFEEILPDLSIEMHVVSDPAPRPGRRFEVRFDLLFELDLTGKASYNREKFARYDAFLTGWALAHPRVRRLGTRPLVVFVSRTEAEMLALMREADEVMRGSVGKLGAPEHEWYFAGRAHVLFTVERDIHQGSLRALKLPALPRALRSELGDDRTTATRACILPPSLVQAGRRRMLPRTSDPSTSSP
jgi:hypothetical protein